MLLVAAEHGKELIACACARAEAAGVRPGMSVAHARAMLRGRALWVQPYTPEEDARQLRRLARWALRFTPIVAADEPDGLLLDIAGCAHLYGGEEKLAERVIAALASLGLEGRVAAAPTFAGARAVARCASRRITLVAADGLRAALALLPVGALRVDAGTCAALAEVGVERIGQLLELPRAELASRFGGTLLPCLDRALGRGVPETIEAVRPAEPVEVSRVFDGPVVCQEAVQAAVRESLALLVGRLSRQERGVCLLALAFQRIDAAALSLTLRLTHPSRDEAHLWSLLRPRLERLHLGYGVEEIHLRAARTERVAHGQFVLWPGVLWPARPAQDAAWGQLLDQLIERLGAECVTTVAPAETYVPERAFVHRPWSAAEDSLRRSGGGGGHDPPRPLRIYPRPEPVRVMLMTPHGPLIRLERQGRWGAVRRCFGPERLALPWWHDGTRDMDAPLAGAAEGGVRDYYTVEDERGRWLWLFGTGAAWFVHGEWA